MAKESDGGAAEVALGRLGVELMVAQRLKYHPYMRDVLLTGLGEDEDVVAVHLHEAPEHRRAGAWAWHDLARGIE